MGDLRTGMRQPPVRSYEQNAKMWAMLSDLANQVKWPVDGELQSLTPDDWKIIVTAGLVRHQRIAKGIEGGFVMLGSRTSKMTKPQMAELIELIYAFGAQNGVVWTEPANDAIAA